MFCDIHEGVYLQHPISWISDTNSALLHAQFEKSKLREQLFSEKKAVPLMKVLLKNWSGKSDEFEKLVREK